MKKYISVLFLGASLTALTACNDFLDREPESSVTPASYFSSVEDLAAYSINRYASNFTAISPGSYGIGPFAYDNATDNQAATGYSTRWVPGEWQTGSGSWDFTEIRNCNYFFDQVLPRFENKQISGNETHIKHYIGEMYVMRAMAFFAKLQDIGDCPIFETALPDQADVLMEASKRHPRHKVARFILGDLEKAAGLLMETGTPSGNKNRISRDVAHLVRSRVALFEGTWLKHHKGTAFVPGGPGWPGDKADLDGFDIDAEIAYFLGEAMKSAQIVGDKYVNRLAENTDAAEGMDAAFNSLNDYYTMFCDTDMEGYDEVLMWRRFNKAQGITHNIQMQLGRNGGGSGWTRGLVNSFLMKNGLPIYDFGSGYDEEWEKQGVKATLQDRDSRIRIFTKKDGDIDFYFYMDGTPTAHYMYWMFTGNDETKNVTGFSVKKGKHYDGTLGAAGTHHMGVTGSVIFRAAEALLNYMEASYEKNSDIDATASQYWKALRRRAKVDENFRKTIAATVMTEEAKGDWGAYSHNQLVDATLYNIRRERRNELIGEGMRWADLCRWRACDQVKNYQIEGMLYWGSTYEVDGVYSEPDADGNRKKIDVKVSVADGTGNMSAETSSLYVRPYQISSINNSVFNGYNFTPAHYLSPLGQSTFRKTATDPSDLNTSVVYQNPGWSKVAGTPPSDVE